MRIKDLNQLIRFTGKVGTVVSVLFILSVLDIFVAGLRESKNEFHSLPGSSIAVNGNLDAKLQTTQDLVFVPESTGLSMDFKEAKGNLWRGYLKLDDRLQPGEYPFVVVSRGIEVTPETHRYRVTVYPDRKTLQRSAKSLIHRYVGVPPFWGVIITLPLILLFFGINYLFSSQKERLLAKEGKAEIFKFKKTGETWEISFGLGQNHGIQKGDIVVIQDPDDTVYGIAEVVEVLPSSANAVVSNLEELRPSFLVRRRDKSPNPSMA